MDWKAPFSAYLDLNSRIFFHESYHRSPQSIFVWHVSTWGGYLNVLVISDHTFPFTYNVRIELVSIINSAISETSYLFMTSRRSGIQASLSSRLPCCTSWCLPPWPPQSATDPTAGGAMGSSHPPSTERVRSPVFLSHRERNNARPSQRRGVLVSKVGHTTSSQEGKFARCTQPQNGTVWEVKSLTLNNHPKSVARQSQCHVKSRDVGTQLPRRSQKSPFCCWHTTTGWYTTPSSCVLFLHASL